MDLPGYTYDSKTKRYFRKHTSASSSFQNVAASDQSELNRLKQTELEKRIDPTVSTITRLETDTAQRLKVGSKFSAHDTLIATRFTTDLFKFKRNIFLASLLTPQGNRLHQPYCNQLVACPFRDLLFGSWVNETGDCVHQIDMRKLLRQNAYSYKVVAKNLVNIYIDSKVEQLHPVLPIGNLNLENMESAQMIRNGPTVLFSIIRVMNNFSESSNLAIHHLPDLNDSSLSMNADLLESKNSVLEMDSLFFCCDTYLNESLVLGGENKCHLFAMSNDNFAINVAESDQFKLKGRNIVQSIQFSKDGQLIYAGTNKGEINVIKTANNDNSTVLKPKCGPIVDIQTLDENKMIVSAQNDYLAKLDIRFVKENVEEPFVVRFYDHVNKSKKIKFSIDDTYRTLTSCGDDNSTRIWSINSGELIRIINFKSEIGERVRKKEFSKDYLLDESYEQIISQTESTSVSTHSSVSNQQANVRTFVNDQQLNATPNLKYYFDNEHREQYQVVSSSNWRCLKKEKRPLIIGSISDSLDLFY